MGGRRLCSPAGLKMNIPGWPDPRQHGRAPGHMESSGACFCQEPQGLLGLAGGQGDCLLWHSAQGGLARRRWLHRPHLSSVPQCCTARLVKHDWWGDHLIAGTTLACCVLRRELVERCHSNLLQSLAEHNAEKSPGYFVPRRAQPPLPTVNIDESTKSQRAHRCEMR